MVQKCLVRGSINIDEFFHLPHIVKPGETISSTLLSRRAGGKGANQACSVARAGGQVHLKGAVGQDGVWVKELLTSYGVDAGGVTVEKEAVTGRAIIQLDVEGENCIILHAGANHSEIPRPTEPLDSLCQYLLLQNEIPLPETTHYLSLAASASAPVSAVFNPSPMLSPEEIAVFPWSQLGWLAVNEGEMEELLRHLGSSSSSKKSEDKVVYVGDMSSFGGSKHEEKMAELKSILEPGLLALSQNPSFTSSTTGTSPNIILTLGSAGSLAMLPPAGEGERKGTYTLIFTPSSKLQGTIRDTTGAGDCFTGFFVGGLMQRETVRGGEKEVEDVQEALRVCTQAAGMCVERHGAQEAVPTMKEVMDRLASLA